MSKTLRPSPVFTLKCEHYMPYCMKFNLNDQILYVGTQNGEILVWNLESNRLKNVTKAAAVCIITIELLIEQYNLVSYCKFGEIKCWRIDGYELVLQHVLQTHTIGFCKLVLHKTNVLLCKGEKPMVNGYSIENFDKITVFNPHKNDRLGDLMVIKSVVDHVFCGYESNTIVVWKEHQMISQYDFPDLETLMALDVDRNVAKGVCAGSSNVIDTFCITDGTLSLDKSVEITNAGVSDLQLRPDDKILAAACWDHTVRLFSWKSMKLLVVLDSHSTGVLNIAFSESSVTFWKVKFILAVVNKDNKITLWDVYNKKNK